MNTTKELTDEINLFKNFNIQDREHHVVGTHLYRQSDGWKLEAIFADGHKDWSDWEKESRNSEQI